MTDWREIHAYLAGQAAARAGRSHEGERRYDLPNLRAAYTRGYEGGVDEVVQASPLVAA